MSLIPILFFAVCQPVSGSYMLAVDRLQRMIIGENRRQEENKVANNQLIISRLDMLNTESGKIKASYVQHVLIICFIQNQPPSITL